MIVYEGIKTDFLSSCEKDSIAIEIEENILTKLGRHTPKAEFRSWENSLNYMYKVLNDSEIPADAGIAIEFNIPQTSKRVDFIISGYGKSDEAGMVIVELKQWDSLEEVNGTDALVDTYVGGGIHRVPHAANNFLIARRGGGDKKFIPAPRVGSQLFEYTFRHGAAADVAVADKQDLRQGLRVSVLKPSKGSAGCNRRMRPAIPRPRKARR